MTLRDIVSPIVVPLKSRGRKVTLLQMDAPFDDGRKSPEFKAKAAARMKALQADPEFKAKLSKAASARMKATGARLSGLTMSTRAAMTGTRRRKA